jgi:hypothetical protein
MISSGRVGERLGKARRRLRECLVRAWERLGKCSGKTRRGLGGSWGELGEGSRRTRGGLGARSGKWRALEDTGRTGGVLVLGSGRLVEGSGSAVFAVFHFSSKMNFSIASDSVG